MHTWPSKAIMKTNKLWHSVPPKGLGGKELEEFYANEREYKHCMLGLIKKEPKQTGKSNSKD
jgi:hypothetical protein